ncbi:hypothetical protein CFOL_v3_23971 [Cephalotus follicularis]|uniref:Uncharacterized protein n=1 Tax=Cephalotus follicularis TaxID=3775 RepID=A0A1Q3CJS4_CEPFO|nr:hypothetical protein CFOL_v3_23971 [Cephalotus follicularis]
MVMEYFKNSFCVLFTLVIFVMLFTVSIGQLPASEIRTLFQVQKLLEYPEVLRGWTNWTNFCYLPCSPSLRIVYTSNHISELTIIRNKSSPAHSPKLTTGKLAVSQQIAPGIFGNSIKIDNILLDDTLTSKLHSYNILLPSQVRINYIA